LEVDVQQGNFKILQLLPQVLILVLVEKWILPSRSEMQKLIKKTEGILGVKGGRLKKLTATDERAIISQINIGKAENAIEVAKNLKNIISNPVSTQTI
jgi:hypothetical protein